MTIYRTRDQAQAYGHELGVLLIDCNQPFVPGDVGNASTWRYPVLYSKVEGCTIDRLIHRADPTLAGIIVDRARWLEAQGVRTITSNCGFMLRFQSDVAAAVRCPVYLSSLLQLPMVLAGLAPEQTVAVVTASGNGLSPALLELARVRPDDPVAVYGMDAYPAFDEPYMQDSGVVDTEALESACFDLGRRIVNEHPNLGAVLLECAILPPYAQVFHRATGRPVFDFVGMIDHVVAAGRPRAYTGTY